MQRYLVRKETNDVWIWTELKSRLKGLTEVWADNAKQALEKEPLPDPKTITIEQIEGMRKEDMLMFASYKLDLNLNGDLTVAELADQIKEAIFLRAPAEAPENQVAMTESKPFANAAAMRKKTGVDAKFAPPGGGDNSSPSGNQPLR